MDKIFLCTAIAGLIALPFAVVHEQRKWDRFAAEHGCQQTGKQRFENTLMPVYNGTTTTVIPTLRALDEWKCRDGETIWRSS